MQRRRAGNSFEQRAQRERRGAPSSPPHGRPHAKLGHGELPRVVLPASLADSLALGHPWVYRDHVPSGLDLPSGTWVLLEAGRFSAFALWDRVSPIALRVFSRVQKPDAAWVRARVREALVLREQLRADGTSAFRLLYGEGDGLPGITVDVYGRFAVIVTYAESLDALLPWLVEALAHELSLDGILRRQRSRVQSDGAERVSVVRGKPPSAPVEVSEHGMRFLADLEAGQKTGLFLDHRENRAYVRAVARGLRVLNLFAYTGGFSVAALLGGASHVTSVDIAAAAVAAARENFALNALPDALHDEHASDVFAYLESARARGERFDLVICDPPSFASSQKQQFSALRAYVRLNALALQCVAPAGLLATASCTAQVSPEDFRHALAQAAARAEKRFQIVHDVGQPLDHPVFAAHREGRYLKFLVGRVLGLA